MTHQFPPALAVVMIALIPASSAAASGATFPVSSPAASGLYSPGPTQGAAGAYDNYIASTSQCPGSDTPTLVTSDQVAAMLCLIDHARAVRGIGALSRSPLLAASASLKADDIVRCDDFSHTACGRPTNATFEQSGYIAPGFETEVGENIAFGSELLGSPRSILRGWLESDGHRENLFRADWRDQGVALRKPDALLGLTANAFWVSQFGTRESAGAGAGPSAAPVRRSASALRLSVRPARVTAGRRIRFNVVLSSAGARSGLSRWTVAFGGRRVRTNSRGHATIVAVLRRPGRYRVVATSGGRRATATVQVVPRRAR